MSRRLGTVIAVTAVSAVTTWATLSAPAQSLVDSRDAAAVGGAHIMGQVIDDETGVPVEGQRVDVYMYGLYDGGSYGWGLEKWTYTTSDGQFDVGGLQDAPYDDEGNTYRVCINAENLVNNYKAIPECWHDRSSTWDLKNATPVVATAASPATIGPIRVSPKTYYFTTAPSASSMSPMSHSAITSSPGV